MGLALGGTFPVSALNVGLAATPPGLQAEIALLASQIGFLVINGAFEVALSLNPPITPALAAHMATALTPAGIATMLAGLVTASGSLQIEALAELGLVDAQLTIVGELKGRLDAGVSTGGLAAWTYRGSAEGYGSRLLTDTSQGFGSVGPDEQINALILATESFEAWGNFGASFNVGDTVERGDIEGPITTESRLTFLGELNGGQLNLGVREFKVPIDLFELQLRGLKVALEASLQVAVGLNLPSLEALLSLDLDIDLALGSFGVDLLVEAQISALTLRIDALLKLIGDINVALSGGGLSYWSYSGTAKGLGESFAVEVANGLPGGSGPGAPAYGVVVATASPDAWASFGTIFKTAG